MRHDSTETQAIRFAHEARLLAVMLRTSRLTWVFGDAGIDAGALLRTGVMPLLQRRAADRGEAATGDSARGLERTERRHTAGTGPAGRRVEAAIYFDEWDGAPLERLYSRLAQVIPAEAHDLIAARGSLVDKFEQLHRDFGLHTVILLGGFEACLSAPADEQGQRRFVDELVLALSRPALPASFLVSMPQEARPLLERFRGRIPGFDHNALRLSLPAATPAPDAPPRPGSGARATGVPAARPAKAQPASEPMGPGRPAAEGRPKRLVRRRGPPPRDPIRVEDVYAFIESKLESTAALAAEEQRRVAGSNPSGAAPQPDPPAYDAQDEAAVDGRRVDTISGPAQGRRAGQSLRSAMDWLRRSKPRDPA